MPRTIDEGFRDFLPKLTPLFWESEAARRHRNSIDLCLRSNFNRQRFFRSGSFGNGTSIAGFSDVDYFAVIPNENLKPNSRATLIQIRNVLKRRFPFTSIRMNRPTVTVSFGNRVSETTEIVPACFISKTNKGLSVYEIPDYFGGWIRSSPDTHTAYVQQIDRKLGGKAKPLVRFMKAWKYYCQVPISSFYLELQVVRYAAQESEIIYDIDLTRLFRLLHNKELARMVDPMGISGYINPCSTERNLHIAKSKLRTVLTRALRAQEAAAKDKTAVVFHWWRLVFGGKFPRYYK